MKQPQPLRFFHPLNLTYLARTLRSLGQSLGRELLLRLWLATAPARGRLHRSLGRGEITVPRILLRPLPLAGASPSPGRGELRPAATEDDGYGSDDSYRRFMAQIEGEITAAEGHDSADSDSDAAFDRFLEETNEAAGIGGEGYGDLFTPAAGESALAETFALEAEMMQVASAADLPRSPEVSVPEEPLGKELPAAGNPSPEEPLPAELPEVTPAAAEAPGADLRPAPTLEQCWELASTALRSEAFAGGSSFDGENHLRWALGRRVELRECTSLPSVRRHPNLAAGALPAPGEEPFGAPLLGEFPSLAGPGPRALASLPRSGRELDAFYRALAQPRPGARPLPLTYAGDFHRATLARQRSSWVEQLFGQLTAGDHRSILAQERRRAVQKLVLAGDDALRRQIASTPGGGYGAFNERTLLELRRFSKLNRLSEPLEGRLPGGRGLRELLPPELSRVGYRALPDNNLWLSQANGYQRQLWESAAGDGILPGALEYLVDYALYHHAHFW